MKRRPGKKRWRPDEDAILRREWERGSSRQAILQALPGRAWHGIECRASRLKLANRMRQFGRLPKPGAGEPVAPQPTEAPDGARLHFRCPPPATERPLDPLPALSRSKPVRPVRNVTAALMGDPPPERAAVATAGPEPKRGER